jgi:hypothetical protein
MQEMKRLNILLLCSLFYTSLLAQDNDSSTLRKLGVASIEKHVYVHAFAGRTDTCLYFYQELDTMTRPSFERVNMQCYGYTQIDEYSYTYEGRELSEMKVSRDGEPLSKTEYDFEAPGRPRYIKTFFYQSNDSTESFYAYFIAEKEQPDSNTMMVIDQNGDTSWSKTIARFDKLGRVVEVVSIDNKRVPLQEVSYELNDSGKAISVATSMYGERPLFVQDYYQYDENGRLVKSYNSRNQTQIYYYYDNGLISNVMNYNAKGELESELIFKYSYR